ncbi:hypothetical protein HY631_04625 [Candidatus Uhrbacteria bacterium]|nr:hypothetical protein [Candidatus Uhrbacteria bacterium]
MAALALTINGETEQIEETDDTRQQAMRRYWQAKQRGDATARLVRLEDLDAANDPIACPPDDDDDPPPAAPARVLPLPDSTVQGGTVSEIARSRIRLQDKWLDEAGFALAPPIYAPGTRVLPVGDANFRTERRRVEALPPFPGAASAIVAAIREERRCDLPLALHHLSMTEKGTLMAGDQEFALEHGAFLQLALQAGFGMGARYLSERCDAPLRAQNVNAQLEKLPGKTVVLRTRVSEPGAPASTFAVVSPRYAPCDADEVLTAVTPSLMDARAEVVYDGSGVRATALFMPDRVVDLAAGDIFKVGVRVAAEDTGRGRVRIAAVAWRNRCLNLLVIDEGEVETVSEVHRGNGARILAAVKDGVEAARAKVSRFLDAWGHARSVRVDPEQVLREWVEHKRVGTGSERTRDVVVEALLTAWHKEPGDTLADAVNAVSRAAHEEPTFGLDFRELLERQAARLVLVPR